MTQLVGQRGMKVDVLVVGAGYAGSVVAERLASAGRRVMVVDKRPHVGGNAYDAYDEHGVLIHRYGPHVSNNVDRRPRAGRTAARTGLIAFWFQTVLSPARRSVRAARGNKSTESSPASTRAAPVA